jgi:hypothetical protein
MAKAKVKAKAKAKAKAQSGLSGFCRVLKSGIDTIKKDIIAERKNITAQSFIRQLMNQQAKPAIIAQAQDRLTSLQDKLEGDEAQLSAFQDEFAADCH